MDTREALGVGSERTTCYVCGHPLRRTPSKLKPRNYCTLACRDADPDKPKRQKRSDAGAVKSPHTTKPCGTCGVPVTRRRTDTREHSFCSRSCFQQHPLSRAGRGRPTESPLGRVRETTGGYLVEFVGVGAPGATSRGWIAQHRLVMQRHLGETLRPEATVHHRNGDTKDNRLENLELWASKHKPGQRVKDLLAYAREILADYEHLEDRL